MLTKQWNSLPYIWKVMVFKEWLLFIKNKFPLSAFLLDDSYGVDFLLIKALGMESDNPNADIEQLEITITNELKNVDENTLYEIFSMEFIVISSEITYIAPLKFFSNIKVIDFHGQNESRITDFEILRRDNTIYVLDYADYQIIDFDEYSNIRDVDNIRYIKGYGFPTEVNCIYPELNANYRIYE